MSAPARSAVAAPWSVPSLAPLCTELAVGALVAAGVDTVFGLHGGPAAAIFEALGTYGDFLSFFLARHEVHAAHAADFYFRVSGRLALVAVTAGPGITNTLTAIETARADGSALFLLAADTPLAWRGRTCAQSLRAAALLREVTKRVVVLEDPARAGQVARELHDEAISGVPGPVALLISSDVASRRVVGATLPFPSSAPIADPRNSLPPRDEVSVARAVEFLRAARRPVILPGYGTVLARAATPLQGLAEALGAFVVTSARAKTIFPETHSLSAGVLGLGGCAEAAEVVTAADLVLVVGERLGDLTTDGFSSSLFRDKKILQVDLLPENIGMNYPVDLPLVGDARIVLEALLSGVTKDQSSKRAPWGEISPARRHVPALADLVRLETGRPLFHRSAVQLLSRLLPPHAHVLADIGRAAMCWPVHGLIRECPPYRFHLPVNFGPMSAALLGAPGAALATSDPVVALVGDAAFDMWHGAALRTAVASRIPYVVVVLDDGGNGMVQEGCQRIGGIYPDPMFPEAVDVLGAAEVAGALAFAAPDGATLAQVLPEAFGAAARDKRPAVVHVPVVADPKDPTPMGSRAKVVTSFSR